MDAPQRIGPYTVLRKLGQGGMGVVYLVRDPDLDRELALKLILDEQAKEVAVERFWREAEALGRIHHRSVVRVHQIGQTPEGTYMVMERVEGEPLDVVLRSGSMEPRKAARILRELADALAAVHAAEILHRDVKPGNVILEPDGIPVLLDFGLIRDASAERLTQTGTTLGTLSYMSPEQTGGESTTQLGPQTDVYSLGVVLFELLTGRRPFAEDNTATLIAHKLYDEAPTLLSVDRSLPRHLNTICRVALARKPEDRYPTAEAMREDLDRYLSGRPPLAVVRQPASRSRALLAALGGLLLLVTLGLYAAWSSTRGVDVAQLDAEASALEDAARDMLRGKGPLRERQQRVDELIVRLRALEAELPAELEPPKHLRQARQRVLALHGLTALARGERAEAAAAVQQLQLYEPPLPATRALRGGVAALSTASDPQVALRELAGARGRGVEPAESLAWRAHALARSPLTDGSAQEVLDLLKALEAAGGDASATPQIALRVRALAHLHHAEAAGAALAELSDPDPDLRWCVALASAEQVLDKSPKRALKTLADLPPQRTLDPNRARLAERVLPLARDDLRRSRSAASREGLGRLLVLAELHHALRPDVPVPATLLDGVFSSLLRVYPPPADVVRLSAILPDDPALHLRLINRCRGMAHPSERRKMFPILERAAKQELAPAERLDLEVGICVTLYQFGRDTECLEQVSRLLAELPDDDPLRSDVFLVRSCVLLRQGRTEEALAAAEEAVAARRVRKWSPFHPSYQLGLTLAALDRTDEAVTVLSDYLSKGTLNHVDYMGRAATLVWSQGRKTQPEAVLRGLRTVLNLHSSNTRWRTRVALLELQLGETDAALANLREAAVGFRDKAPALGQRVSELAAGVEDRGAAALPDLEAFVGTLDEDLETEKLRN